AWGECTSAARVEGQRRTRSVRRRKCNGCGVKRMLRSLHWVHRWRGRLIYDGRMKAHTEYLTFNTDERYEMVHITPQVEAVVKRSGVVDGLWFVSPVPISAG